MSPRRQSASPVERPMEDEITLPQMIDGLSAPTATMTADGRVEHVPGGDFLPERVARGGSALHESWRQPLEARMSEAPFLTRRRFFATAASAAVASFGLFTSSRRLEAMTDTLTKVAGKDLRPFKVSIPEEQITDLHRRIKATQWPERETVTDASQGVQLATIQALTEYWATKHDWRKVEARLNSFPQFLTEIDGLDIHFLDVRSKHDNALPLVITHGWPGSILEQMKIIEPLTNPTAHGGAAADAFHVVVPSLPGHGFSAKPTTTGWDPIRIARAWVVLMKRLGYTRFVAQGGDWGNAVTEQMALLGAAALVGMYM